MLESDTYRFASGDNDTALHMKDVRQQHLKDKMQEDGYRRMLELIVQNKFVQCGEGQVIYMIAIPDTAEWCTTSLLCRACKNIKRCLSHIGTVVGDSARAAQVQAHGNVP